MTTVLLAGCGKMGGALLDRWQAQKRCTQVYVVDPHAPENLNASHVADVSSLPPSFLPDVVVMAVKPQTLEGMIAPYKAFADKGALLLSIAAGKPLSFFERHLGGTAAIVRAMPNTPASIGCGISVAVANKNTTPAQKDAANALLASVGDVLWTEDEGKLNAVTALSGSGPAYVFLLIEAMTQSGIRLGLAPAMAEQLARQTVIGSAALAQASKGVQAAELRMNVTSPNGTTAAALSVLMAETGLQNLFDRALEAAAKRAQELSQ